MPAPVVVEPDRRDRELDVGDARLGASPDNELGRVLVPDVEAQLSQAVAALRQREGQHRGKNRLHGRPGVVRHVRQRAVGVLLAGKIRARLEELPDLCDGGRRLHAEGDRPHHGVGGVASKGPAQLVAQKNEDGKPQLADHIDEEKLRGGNRQAVAGVDEGAGTDAGAVDGIAHETRAEALGRLRDDDVERALLCRRLREEQRVERKHARGPTLARGGVGRGRVDAPPQGRGVPTP